MQYLCQHKNKSAVAIFKKWSRKAYAIFSSLGIVVHISHLSVAVLQKTGDDVSNIEHTLRKVLEQLTEKKVGVDVLITIALANNADEICKEVRIIIN